jgi:hypothetical protein
MSFVQSWCFEKVDFIDVFVDVKFSFCFRNISTPKAGQKNAGRFELFPAGIRRVFTFTAL